MEKSKYDEIRNRDNFLWLYFKESGGKRLNEASFMPMLSLWIQMTMGMPPTMGMEKIKEYLDEKHK